MTYARLPGWSVVSGTVVDDAASIISVNGESNATNGTRPAGRSSIVSSVPTSTVTRLSATMNAIRSTGNAASIGRYAPPAFHTPKIAVIIWTPRGRHNPTTDSGPTP